MKKTKKIQIQLFDSLREARRAEEARRSRDELNGSARVTAEVRLSGHTRKIVVSAFMFQYDAIFYMCDVWNTERWVGVIFMEKPVILGPRGSRGQKAMT